MLKRKEENETYFKNLCFTKKTNNQTHTDTETHTQTYKHIHKEKRERKIPRLPFRIHLISGLFYLYNFTFRCY